MKKIAVFTIILIITCGTVIVPAAFASTLTVALFDLSGSVLTDNTGNEGNESPYKKNMSELKKEINRLNKGDMLIIIGFGRKSDVTLLKASMPRQGGPGNQNLIMTRQAAIKKLEENIEAKGKYIDNTQTDIIGSLFRAVRIIEESDSPDIKTKRIVVYSDMLDTCTLMLSLKKLKANDAYKAFLKKYVFMNIGFPDLKDVEIYIFSTFSDIKGITTIETEIAITELKEFWIKFITAGSGQIKSYRTNY